MPISKNVLTEQDDNGLSLRHVNAKDTTIKRRFNVNLSQSATVQINVASRTGSGSYSSWTIRVSLDGITFANVPNYSTGLTLSTFAAAVSDIIDVAGYMMLEVACTTASTYTTETVDIIVCRQS